MSAREKKRKEFRKHRDQKISSSSHLAQLGRVEAPGSPAEPGVEGLDFWICFVFLVARGLVGVEEKGWMRKERRRRRLWRRSIKPFLSFLILCFPFSPFPPPHRS